MVLSSFIQHSPDLKYIKDSGFVNINQVIPPPPSFSIRLYFIYLGYSLGCDISFYVLWHFQRFWWHVTQIDSVLRQQSRQWVNCPAVFQITNHSNLQVHCIIIKGCNDIFFLDVHALLIGHLLILISMLVRKLFLLQMFLLSGQVCGVIISAQNQNQQLTFAVHIL